MMTPNEVDRIIEAAGLKDVMQVFNSAIEIDTYATRSNGDWHDAYSALATLIAYVREHALELPTVTY